MVKGSGLSMFESGYLDLTDRFKTAELGKAVIWAALRPLQGAEVRRCALEPTRTVDLVSQSQEPGVVREVILGGARTINVKQTVTGICCID